MPAPEEYWVADAMYYVIKKNNYDVEKVLRRVPNGFWNEVEETLGEEGFGSATEVARVYYAPYGKYHISILLKELISKNADKPCPPLEEVFRERIRYRELNDRLWKEEKLRKQQRLLEQQTLPAEQSLSAEESLSPQQITIDDIYRIANEVLDKRLSEFVYNEHTSSELVPEPVTIKDSLPGRRQTRKYERVSITVDTELWKLFKDQQRRLNSTAPRLMDSILWSYYGKPSLSYSFENESEDHTE